MFQRNAEYAHLVEYCIVFKYLIGEFFFELFYYYNIITCNILLEQLL